MIGKIESITIIGRRWFDKVNGNTYCSSMILINGKKYKSIGFSYGYDNYYIQMSMELLASDGLINPDSNTQPLWSYCKDNDIELETFYSDGLKRELFKKEEF